MKRLALALLLALGVGSAVAQTYFRTGTSQKIDYGCTPSCSVQTSSAWGAQTQYIRVVAHKATAYINFAASGGTLLVTAATGIYLPVEEPQIFRVPANGKLGIMAASTTGSVWITELTQ